MPANFGNHDISTSGSITANSITAATGNFTTSLEVNGIPAPIGVGAIDFVTKWTDNNILGTGVIFDDGTNIGIGTASPSHKLDVKDGSSKGFFAGGVWYADHITGNGDSGFVIRSAENNKWSIQNDESEGDTFHIRSGGFVGSSRFKMTSSETVLNEDGNGVDFRVEGDADQNLLFVQGAGGHDNVAIGTNTPLDTAKFQIYNEGSTAKLYSQIIGGNNKGHGLLNNQSVIETLSQANSFYSYMFPSTNGNVTSMYHFRADPPTGVAGTVSNQAAFYAGAGLAEGNSNYGFMGQVPSGTNNYNIYMASSAKNYFNGDVGIGTLSPSSKLHVKDGIVRIERSNEPAILFHDANGATSQIRGGDNNIYIADPNGAKSVTFETDTGYVGIGTASPSYKLDVAGSGHFDDNISVGLDPLTNNFGLEIYKDKPHIIQRLSDPSGAIIHGNWYGNDEVRFASIAHYGPEYSESSAFNIGPSGSVFASYVADIGIGTLSNDSLIFGTDNTERARINPAGWFAIGTDNPSAKLNVENGNVVFNDLGGTYNFRVEGDADQYLLFVRGDAGADKVGVGTPSLYGKLNTAQTTTNDAGQPRTLDVRSNDYTTANGQYYTFGEVSTCKKYVDTGVTDTGYIIGKDILCYLSDEGSLNGAVGIRTYAGLNDESDDGTLTYAYGIQPRVINNSNVSGSIFDARGVDVYINGDFRGVGNGKISNAYGVYIGNILNATNSYGVYQAGGTNKNYFAGDVGIGAPSPSEKLDVNGKIKSTLSYTAMHSATSLAVGWYTVAVNYGNRAIGRFGLTCSSGARHQGIIFYASHFYGLGNQISVLHNNRYSLKPVAKLRIKEGGTYDGCLLQVYIDDAVNTPEVYLLNDNINTTGWVVVDWVPDGTNPGVVANFAALTNVAVEVDLDTMEFGTTAQTSLDGPVVINEGGSNNDFRVEGDADQNLLFTDASTDRVGINTSDPQEKLSVTSLQTDIAGFHGNVTGPFASGDLQSLVIRNSTDSLITEHYENTDNTSTKVLKNLIRYGADFVSIDDAYDTAGLGTTFYPKFKVNTDTGAITFNDQFTFPTTDGSSGQVLVTNGSGVLSWENQSGGGTGSAAAWGSYNGSTNARGQEYNISSVTDNGSVGAHTVNLSVTMSSTDYCVVVNEYHRTSNTFGTSSSVLSKTTTAFGIVTGGINGTTPSQYDSIYVAYAVFGS